MNRRRIMVLKNQNAENVVFTKSLWTTTGATSNQNIVSLSDFLGYKSGKTYRLTFDYDITTVNDGTNTIRVINTGAFGASGIIVDASTAGNHKDSASYDITAKADGGMLLRFSISASTVTATLKNLKVVEL